MQQASPNHDIPVDAALRTSAPVYVPPPRPAAVVEPLPRRPVLLPLVFVLTAVALVGFGSAALTLGLAYLFFAQDRAVAQGAAVPLRETKPAAVEAPPRPEAEKPKLAPPAPDTLAILPFEMLFEPTPKFRHQVEKLNEALPQLLTDEGKLRVKPLAQTAPLRYRHDPIADARELHVRAVLVVKFTTEPSQDLSACHLELIDVVTGFLLWGTEIEAPGGFLKNPDCFTHIRQAIIEEVPKRLAPQQ